MATAWVRAEARTETHAWDRQRRCLQSGATELASVPRRTDGPHLFCVPPPRPSLSSLLLSVLTLWPKSAFPICLVPSLPHSPCAHLPNLPRTPEHQALTSPSSRPLAHSSPCRLAHHPGPTFPEGPAGLPGVPPRPTASPSHALT